MRAGASTERIMMGYFSNGTEDMQYHEQYCDRCINWRESSPDADDWGCPVMDLHVQWNYEQQGKGRIRIVKKQALDNFIEQKEDTFCDKCKMFIEKPNADVPGQLTMFETAKN